MGLTWGKLKSHFDRGKLVRNEHTEFPEWPYVGRLALAEKAKPNKIPTQPPPQRCIVVMTLGVQLCLRWFMEGHRLTAGEAV
jgi:hypothetical protein